MIFQFPSSMIATMINFYYMNRSNIKIVKVFNTNPVHFISFCRDYDSSFYNMRSVISEIKSRNYDVISTSTKLLRSEFGNLIEFLASARLDCIIEEGRILKSIREVKIAASNRSISDYEFGKLNSELDSLRFEMRELRAIISIREDKHKREVEKRYKNFDKYLELTEIECCNLYWNKYIFKKGFEKMKE